jgi:hypothetical protein
VQPPVPNGANDLSGLNLPVSQQPIDYGFPDIAYANES